MMTSTRRKNAHAPSNVGAAVIVCVVLGSSVGTFVLAYLDGVELVDAVDRAVDVGLKAVAMAWSCVVLVVVWREGVEPVARRLWARQRPEGADWAFAGFCVAVGAVFVAGAWMLLTADPGELWMWFHPAGLMAMAGQ